MKKIIIYSNLTCCYCQEAKEFFRSKNIPFEERNISENPIYKKELLKLMSLVLPTIIIDNKVIRGFNKKKIEKELDSNDNTTSSI